MLKRYTIPSEKGEGWAVILIDTEIGFFATCSDWGNFAYLWTHPGMEFRKFLAQLTPDYLHKKLLFGRESSQVFDGEKTAELIKEALNNKDRALLKEKGRSWKRYNQECALLEQHTPMEKEDFDSWQSETGLEEPWQYKCTKPEPQAMSFCTKVWPRFKALLEAELLKEDFERHS
jgi:hypothetical protein